MSFLGFDLITLIKTAGYIGVFGFVFAESGLLIGFFLPGDSLLFTAGFLASQGFLDIILLCIGVFIAAVVGDNVGYAFGKKVGPKLFTRDDSVLFHKNHLAKAQHFYEAHGKKTIVLARFIPAVRTFAPIVAGIGNMHYKTFFAYNVLGGLIWGVGLPLAGYFLGSAVPDIDRYILPIVGGIILLSLIPPVYHIIRHHRKK